MITFERLHIGRLDFNTGQIPGLPPNPREWTDLELKRLAKSMKNTPELVEARGCIVVPYEGRYVVLGGNLRLAAAKYLKWPDIMCAVLPEGTKVSKLKEIVLKDNSSFGSWDLSLLRKDWAEFDFGDWGINVTWDTAGPTPDASVSEREVVEDDFDETTSDIAKRCKRGNIWQLGDHRLMCGDSTKVNDVQMLMGGAEADMVFTDPPYNVAIGDKNKALNALTGSHSIERNLEGDTYKTDEECGEKLWKPAFTAMRKVSKSRCAIYVTMPQGGTHMMMMMLMMHEAGWQVKHELIWMKDRPTFSMGRLDYDYQHEPICFGWNKTHKKIGAGKYTKSVWAIDKPAKCDLHPTMKPIELIVNALLNSSEENDNILDCFGGSGSTLMACEQTGRHCYMMEYDEHYCDVIIARWEKYTGRKATKIE